METWTDLSWVNLHERFMSMTRRTSGLNTASQSWPSLRNSGGTVAGSRSMGMLINERGRKRRSRREEGKRVGKTDASEARGTDRASDCLKPARERLLALSFALSSLPLSHPPTMSSSAIYAVSIPRLLFPLSF